MLTLIFIISLITNIILSQSCLGGELRTYESYTYGRYEVRMKPAFGNGYVSSFFTYHDFWETDFGNWQTFINEIDIEFTGNLNNSIQFTTHHPGAWSETNISELSFNPFDEYQNYAIEWTPEYVKWFVNDQEVYIQNQTIVDDLVYPQKIMMNIWSSIYDDWTGEWLPDSMPVYSFYDYVKYYSYDLDNGNYGSDNNFSHEWTENFDSFNDNRWDEATHGFDGNNCIFTPLNVLIHNGKLILQVTQTDYILGDVNNDATLDIIDIVSIISMILSFEVPVNVADYNQDNNLNIIDIIFIIDLILHN